MTNDNEPTTQALYQAAISACQIARADELAGVLMGAMMMDDGPAQTTARRLAVGAINADCEKRKAQALAISALLERFAQEARDLLPEAL